MFQSLLREPLVLTWCLSEVTERERSWKNISFVTLNFILVVPWLFCLNQQVLPGERKWMSLKWDNVGTVFKLPIEWIEQTIKIASYLKVNDRDTPLIGKSLFSGILLFLDMKLMMTSIGTGCNPHRPMNHRSQILESYHRRRPSDQLRLDVFYPVSIVQKRRTISSRRRDCNSQRIDSRLSSHTTILAFLR